MPTFTATAAAPGDLGPAQTLTNKSCGTTITVTFAGATLTASPGAGDYTADANWEVFAPEGSGVSAMSGPSKDTAAQTFTPDVPGRYLVELNATFFDDGLSYRFTSLIEVKDPQLRDTSAPASNEQQEMDADEGWSIALQKAFDSLGNLYSYKQIVSVTSAGSILGDKTVTPMKSDAWLAQWKSATVSFENFKNYSVEVEAVTESDTEVQDQPIMLMLHEVDGTDPDLEKGYALLRGVVNYDTTTIHVGGGPAVSAGDILYVKDGTNTFTKVKPAGGPPYPRYVGKVIKTGAATGASPGVILFDGTGTAFFSDAYITGKLTVDGLIDPSGLELTPVAANPGGVAANTLWLDSTTGNALRWGANLVQTAAGTPTVTTDAGDPSQSDDSAAGDGPGDIWINTTTEDTFVCVDDTVGAAVWRRISTHTEASDPTTGDDDARMYSVGDKWYNSATFVQWTCLSNATGAAIWRRDEWEVKATTGAVATAEHKVHYICNDAGGGGFTITLPAVASSIGVEIRVTNNDPTPDTFTVDGNGAETIAGVATYTLPNRYDTVKVSCDGTEWFVE